MAAAAVTAAVVAAAAAAMMRKRWVLPHHPAHALDVTRPPHAHGYALSIGVQIGGNAAAPAAASADADALTRKSNLRLGFSLLRGAVRSAIVRRVAFAWLRWRAVAAPAAQREVGTTVRGGSVW